MPNTNPSDLDLEALKAALGAWTWQMSYTSGEIEENLQSAIAAYLTSLPRASGVPEAEAAAWRLDWIGDGGWQFTDSEASAEYARKKGKRVEPLFASPPPVAAPSGEALRYAAQFLIDRLGDFELDETNAKEMCRQYLGFVAPAIARLEMVLASPIASGAKP